MKRKLMSFLVILTFVVGMVGPYIKAEAAETTDVALAWKQSRTIEDVISVYNREATEGEAVFNWVFGAVGDNASFANNPNNKYVFTYNLEDGRRVELTIHKSGENATTFSYRVLDLVAGGYLEGDILAYDEKGTNKIFYQYHKASEASDGGGAFWNIDGGSTYWENATTGGVKAHRSIFQPPAGITVTAALNGATGAVEGVDAVLAKDTAVAFKYNGNLVTLRWEAAATNTSQGTIHVGIDSIERSRIYKFNLECLQAGTKIHEQYVNVLRLLEFSAKPQVDKYIIDKGLYPEAHPGQEQKLRINFAIPKVWDSVNNKYTAAIKYSDSKGTNGLSANVLLKTSENATESVHVNIPDIYSVTQAPIVKSGGIQVYGTPTLTPDTEDNRYYTLLIEGEAGEDLIASDLFTVATISIQPLAAGVITSNTALYTMDYGLAVKDNAYTFLDYDAKTQGDGERVLIIDPYNANGTYYVFRATTPTSLPQTETFELSNSVIVKYDYSVLGGAEQIMIPIVNSEDYYYTVQFVYEQGVICSQILKDNPDRAAYLKTPELTVKPGYKIITETTGSGATETVDEKVKMVLEWDAGREDVILNLINQVQSSGSSNNVSYIFSKTPFSPREGQYTNFLELVVDLQATADAVTINLANTDINKDATGNMAVSLVDTWGVYKTGVSTSITIDEEGNAVKNWICTAIVEFPAYNVENLTMRDEPSKIFYYPSVYYLKARGTYVDINGNTNETPSSMPVNITLDKNSQSLLPPPQDVAVDNITAKTFEFKWKTISDENYGEYIEVNNYELLPNGAKVNLFLTQKNVVAEEDSETQLAYFTDYDNIISVNFSTVDITTPEDNITTIDLSPYINYIRQNKMLRIIEIPQDLSIINSNMQEIKIIGLDKNTIYYTAAQTLLKVTNITDGLAKDVLSTSISEILSLTTKKEDILVGPDAYEVEPITPYDFRIDDTVEVSTTTVNLIWSEVADTPSLNSTYIKKEYEIIKTEEKIDELLLSKRNAFEEFWAEDLSEIRDTKKTGWQTNSTVAQPQNLLLYNAQGQDFNVLTSTEKYEYEYEDRNPTLVFTDKTLMPNKIFYYYIRTVRMVKDASGVFVEAAYSSWEPLTITTNPITAPVDLKLERNNTYFAYDKEKEIVISFFAAIPQGTTMSEIAALYPLEYSIMKDGGEWETMIMDVTAPDLFKDGNVIKDGYRQFVYRITDLEQGKGYSVRVRMKARINDIAETIPVYDISLYSNTVQFRTDMNQEEYDIGKDVEKWIGLYDDELMKLTSGNYWVTDDSSTRYTAIYRSATFDGELQKAVSSAYSFESDNQTKQVYYIPAEALQRSNELSIGFMGQRNGMQVLIRPDSITDEGTVAIKTILENINAKNIKDYYLKIELTWGTLGSTVNTQKALSEQVQVKMSVVGMKDVEKKLDASFVELFEKAISGTAVQTAIRASLETELEKEIGDSASNDVLYELVSDAVQEAYGDLMSDIEDNFEDNIKNSYPVTELSNNMLISTDIDSKSTVSGYIKNSTVWESLLTDKYYNKTGFETKLLGIFVFAGKEVNISSTAGLPNSLQIKDLITKYGLDDYLGKDIIDINAMVTKQMVAGCVARIAGASATQNDITYLKSLGVDVSSSKLYNNFTNQETLYLIMSLYELKTGTNISTIRITNYNAMPSINDADAAYKKSLQVAVQLGIWTDDTITPEDKINIKMLLEYLAKLNEKVAL